MPTQKLGFSEPDKAAELANEIYDLSKDCWMAHSIRAVEAYLQRRYNFYTRIILKRDTRTLAFYGRRSWCSPSKAHNGITFIYVDDSPDLEKTWKRFCVAHELYHVIWSVADPASAIRPRTNAPNPQSRKFEIACDEFANALCKLHHEFYSNDQNIKEILFTGWPFHSVDPG